MKNRTLDDSAGSCEFLCKFHLLELEQLWALHWAIYTCCSNLNSSNFSLNFTPTLAWYYVHHFYFDHNASSYVFALELLLNYSGFPYPLPYNIFDIHT